MDHYASVGFNIHESVDNFQGFQNHVLSQTPDVGLVACNLTSLGSPWTNVIYRIGVSVNDKQRSRSRCLMQLAEDELRYNVSTDSLLDQLPVQFSDCPCTIFQVERDLRFFTSDNISSPEDVICYINHFPIAYSSGSTINLFHRCYYSMRFV